MRIKNKKIYFITACYLAAFAAIGAGFAYCVHLSEEKYDKFKDAVKYSTLSDAASHMERLARELTLLSANPSDNRTFHLSEIKTEAELARASLGRMPLSPDACGPLFSFLTVCSDKATSELASDENTVNDEVLTALAGYALKAEAALPSSVSDFATFEADLTEIFRGKELEFPVSDDTQNEFHTLVGDEISPDDACNIARSVLGRRAILTAKETNGKIPIYSVGGKNIYAIVSKKGGFLLQFLFDLDTGEKRITETEAQEIAELFVTGNELIPTESIALSESAYTDGVYIYEFYPINDGERDHSHETIRIGVSHGSGRIVLFDALEYYRYHKSK